MYAISRLNSLFNSPFDELGLFPKISSSSFASDYSIFKRKDDNTWFMELPVPGLTEKDVDIQLDTEQRQLTVKARKESCESKEENDQIIWSKKAQSNFFYSFDLMDNLDLDSVKATCQNGILSIEIKELEEKTEHSPLKHIEVMSV